MKRSQALSIRFGGLLVVFSFLLATAGASLAQEATPADAAVAHPAHIHEGTCAELGSVVFPLTDVAAPASTDGDDMAASGSPIAVETSITTIDVPLADVVNGDHAINVHESADNIGNYIACGDIGGTIVPGAADGGELMIGLHELNDSGYSGIAVLREAGDQTDVTVYLAQGLTGEAASTPESADAEHRNAAASIQVDISDFAFNPDPVTIKAGESVTWTNQDSAPHTATAQDRDVLQSGTLNQGESFTQTFDTPGTYEYFCEFHPDMKGVIIVE